MGRVSKKTQITGKSIGKKDNQTSNGIELEHGVINQPEWLLHPILFSQVYVNYRMQYLTKHLLGWLK